MEKIKQHICFYNDSPIWGGHEIMSVAMANTLSKIYKVTFIYSNQKYEELLDDNIKHIKISITSTAPLPFIRNINIRDIFFNYNLMKTLNIDLCIIVQGTIELSTKGLIAASLLGVKKISYIPLTYNFSFMRSNKVHIIRDIINQFYYALPDGYITPAYVQSNRLKNKGLKNIYTVNNPVNIVNPSQERQFQYKINNLLEIVYIGRLRKKQKNIYSLIYLCEYLRDKNLNFVIKIIGGGEDEESFKNSIISLNIEKYFIFYGWQKQNEIYDIITQSSIVLAPSKFETELSLVILELLYHEIPFIVSDIEAFDEIPKKYKFNLNKIEELGEIFLKIYNNQFSFDELLKFKSYIMGKHTDNHYGKELLKTIEEVCKK